MSRHFDDLDAVLEFDTLDDSGGNPYQYPVAGGDYTKLGLEQQAQIVSDWFSGNKPNGTNQTGVPKENNSPYFRYVQENVRIGRF